MVRRGRLPARGCYDTVDSPSFRGQTFRRACVSATHLRACCTQERAAVRRTGTLPRALLAVHRIGVRRSCGGPRAARPEIELGPRSPPAPPQRPALSRAHFYKRSGARRRTPNITSTRCASRGDPPTGWDKPNSRSPEIADELGFLPKRGHRFCLLQCRWRRRHQPRRAGLNDKPLPTVRSPRAHHAARKKEDPRLMESAAALKALRNSQPEKRPGAGMVSHPTELAQDRFRGGWAAPDAHCTGVGGARHTRAMRSAAK